jgi:hypothetical protein
MAISWRPDKMEKFEHIHKINTDSLKPFVKEAKGGEDEICHTIEELLGLNKLIPKRTNKAIMELQEGQLAKEDNRWSSEELTEKQFDGKKRKEMVGHELDPHKDNGEIVEVRLNNPKNDTRREEAWDKDDEKVRGHKNVAPLWIQVYKQEEDRKKLDKKQLEKKKK